MTMPLLAEKRNMHKTPLQWPAYQILITKHT